MARSITAIHKDHPELLASMIGGCEETTTGIIRLHSMVRDGALKTPVIAVNDNKTKHLMDNYYGTGQSTSTVFCAQRTCWIADRTVVVPGYGSSWQGESLCVPAGLVHRVIVEAEVDAFCGLQAAMDGQQSNENGRGSRSG